MRRAGRSWSGSSTGAPGSPTAGRLGLALALSVMGMRREGDALQRARATSGRATHRGGRRSKGRPSMRLMTSALHMTKGAGGADSFMGNFAFEVPRRNLGALAVQCVREAV